MANPLKKQLKAAKKQEKQLGKQQEIKNSQIRMAAQKAGTPVPFGAQKKAGFFNSTEAQPTSISTLTPQQQTLVSQLSGLIPRGLQNLNLPGQQSSFAPIANEARRNFSENTLPTLAERFAGLGRNSSGLQQTLGGAAGDFESQLAGQESQYGMQEQGMQSNNLFNLLQAGLNPQFDYGMTPGQNSGIRNIWDSVKQPAMNAGIGYLSGGPVGAGLGALSGMASNSSNQQQAQNGTGVGQNSFGFSGQKPQAWQPQQNQLSTQNIASSGYPQVNDIFNQGQYKF